MLEMLVAAGCLAVRSKTSLIQLSKKKVAGHTQSSRFRTWTDSLRNPAAERKIRPLTEDAKT